VIGLPSGWVRVPLKSLLSSNGIFSDGDWIESKDQDPNGSFRLLQLADIGDGYFVDKSSRFVNEEKFAALNCTELKTGDVLIARMPDPLGRACLLPEMSQPCITVVDVAVFRTGEKGASNKWLMNAINSPQAREFMETNSSGTTRKRISRGKLADMELPVPPLPEQKRIADKLDAVLARVDACRDRLDRIPAILKRFRQSVLAAATSGKLTEDWRTERVGWADEGSPTNEAEEPRWASQAQPNLRAARDSAQLRYAVTVDEADGWTSTDVQTVAQVGTGSTPLRSNQAFFSATGTPWVTSAATAKPIVLAADEFVTDAAIVAHRLKKFPAGTLLVAMYGEGKTRGQVSELGIEATISQACAAVVVDEKRAQKEFVKLALQANYLEMRGLAEGGNQPNLNLSKIKEFPLRLPSRDEQTEIVRRVESLFAYADRLEARYAAARAQVGKLAPAMLAKAFRGELVPQDPNDEPASVLLARIRAQCGEQAANKPKRGRKAAV
jgi:type I restriction enzyme S subunit